MISIFRAKIQAFQYFCSMARRKTLKKEQYQLFDNCFNSDVQNQGNWKSFFGNENPITLELGCGKAELSYGLAQMYPDRNYLGIDLKMDRMWRPAKEAIEAGIHNIGFLCLHLLSIDEHFAAGEADEIWITFPDPFPKNRQSKHRMVNATFLDLYRKVIKPGGKIHYKTDNTELFQYSMETFVEYQDIHFHQLSFDLHEDDRISEDKKVKTTYEKQFMGMGEKIKYVSFSFDQV